MVGGQMMDLALEGEHPPLPEITRLARMKTAALITFCCEAGAIMGKASAAARQALVAYGQEVGLAYQIADDLLDVEGDAAALGKPAGADAALNKTTFVTQLGVEGAKKRVADLIATADASLSIFGAKGDVLKAASRFVAERKS